MRIDVARAFVSLACGAPYAGFGAAVLGLVACGGAAHHSSPVASNDAGGTTGPFVGAPHAPLPQTIFHGGPLLTAPKIVTITFPGDPNAAALEAFDDTLTTSSWWSTVTAGFCGATGTCIGRGSSGGHVRMTNAPAAAYTDATGGFGQLTLQAFILDQLDQGVLPEPDASTLYVFYLPASTVISLDEAGTQTGKSCSQFRAYHNALTDSALTPLGALAYAVIEECPPNNGLTPLDALTFSASHEILEAATDPVQQELGFYLDLSDTAVLGWNLLAGGEAADLCIDVTGLRQDQTSWNGLSVQRIWSNANAARGIDPCVPVPAEDVYFNVAPEGTSSYLVLAVGGVATFELDAFSTAATAPWTIEAIDWGTAQGLVKAPLLTFTLDGKPTATAQNGDKIEVSMSLDADPGELGGAVGVFLSVAGALDAPTAAHVWPIVVVTPAEAAGGS